MGHHRAFRGPRRREREAQSSFKEIIAENFTSLRKETDIQIQEDWKVPNIINPKDSH